MAITNEKCFRLVIIIAIAISAVTAAIGLYIGLAQNDIVLLAATLVVIELFVALGIEFTGAFKDRLSKQERHSAKSSDISTLKKAGIKSS